MKNQKLILYFSESSCIFCSGAIGLEQDESFQNWLAFQDSQNIDVDHVKFIRKY